MDAYLDNAATTPLAPEVTEAMSDFMGSFYGNPSSTHAKGREARVEIEKARKTIAKIIGAQEREIIFTSGGTEANNTILKSLALSGSIEYIISSPIEHHSVLDALEWIKNNTNSKVVYLNVNHKGHIDNKQLEDLLSANNKALVSLMHANNEIGNILDLEKIGELCNANNALFHTDMVQTLGHYPLRLNELPIDYATGSAHKIHGPKGVGFMYTKSKSEKPEPLFHGGAQERGLRGGTENGIGIIGMAKAFNIASTSMGQDKEFILSLKKRMIDGLKANIPNTKFNGDSELSADSLYTLLNVQLPGKKEDTFLFNLDLKGVAVSEGSACSSGAPEGSHVLRAMGQPDNDFNNIRISFSRFNTFEEVDYAIHTIAEVHGMLQ